MEAWRTLYNQFSSKEEILADAGVADLDRYAVVPGTVDFYPDFFIDEVPGPTLSRAATTAHY